MSALFRKLQLKDQDRIYVLGAPPEFRPHLDEVREIVQVSTSPNCKKRYGFAMFFVKDCADIGRDDGWQPLGDLGFEGVRQIAIDEDWSAIRFRHVDHIKTMRRAAKRAMSAKGKRRAGRK